MVFLKELIEFSYEFSNFKKMILKMVIVIQKKIVMLPTFFNSNEHLK
jgi:hypothetical protein